MPFVLISLLLIFVNSLDNEAGVLSSFAKVNLTRSSVFSGGQRGRFNCPHPLAP